MIEEPTEILRGLSVSRETLDGLKQLEGLVRRWTPAINLVSRSTIPLLWERHILDSVQLFALAPPEANHWVDLGSGGGFPGLAIAVLAKQARPDLEVTLVDSDLRKLTFLREAVRMLGLSSRVIGGRIESVPPQGADVLSARALADLPNLLVFAKRHLREGGLALFPKGARYEEELARARKGWIFDVSVLPSVTDGSAAILKIGKIRSASQE